MKLLITIIFNVCLALGSMAQQKNSKAYYQSIVQAQLAFAKDDYKQASELYAKAFRFKPPFWYDMHQAMQIELDYAGGRKEMMKQYMQYCGGKGKEQTEEEYLKIMEQVYPAFANLPYVNELIEAYKNTEPMNDGEYVYGKEFKELLDKDQAIRDSAYQVLGYGNNIYTSHMSDRIKQVDQKNMDKLLMLIQDPALNEYNCHECFTSLEIVILHNAAHGNMDWINPVETIFNNGRMEIRRFVRMMDEVTHPDVSEQLKIKGLYYGSFNGIRLYNLMYFTQFSKEEKSMINHNRKKIGFMSVADEIKLKSWQFQHNDLMNFCPFKAFMYSDGTEDEATKNSMLKEQAAMLEQASRYQKEMGNGELIIVRR